MNLVQKISFIGAGNMATSIIGGLVRTGIAPTQMTATSPDQAQLRQLQTEHGILIAASNPEAVATCDILVPCVKPQVIEAACEELRDSVQQRRPLTISIAAAIGSDAIGRLLGRDPPLVPCLPHPP